MTTTAVAPATDVLATRRYTRGAWRIPAARIGGTGGAGPVVRVVIVSGDLTPVSPTALPR